MYSESEIDQAVDAGILSRDDAASFRLWVAKQRALPAVDEEHFRLISGFNDIFVAIAAIITLVPIGAIGGGLLVAAAAWGLAEFFTRKRRMAFPSIVLLVAFVGGLFSGLFGLVPSAWSEGWRDLGALGYVTLILLTVAALTALHWWRFKVPIAMAGITGCIAALLLSWLIYALGMGAVEGDEPPVLAMLFIAGLAIFAFAMWWDISDRERQTRRSDVAFWLHLLASPLIVHPLFISLGAMDGDLNAAGSLIILALYLFMGLVALAVDRRAILVSALAYVLVALGALFRTANGIGGGILLNALILGCLLLLLSAFWSNLRTMVVGRLPGAWQARLPLTHFGEVGARLRTE